MSDGGSADGNLREENFFLSQYDLYCKSKLDFFLRYYGLKS